MDDEPNGEKADLKAANPEVRRETKVSADPTRRRRLLAKLPAVDYPKWTEPEARDLERFLEIDHLMDADAVLEPLRPLAPERLR
ncbi:hypothetical protein LBMAG42_54910 [Deltaproteobacteria bacterium]|nr:hypothetical protein LBMAG42_54910 [Deltaproteobacteria bacterium]